jgi:hypothetical protein
LFDKILEFERDDHIYDWMLLNDGKGWEVCHRNSSFRGGLYLFSLRGTGLLKKKRERKRENRLILIYIFFVASFQAIKRSKGKKIRTISITTTTK